MASLIEEGLKGSERPDRIGRASRTWMSVIVREVSRRRSKHDVCDVVGKSCRARHFLKSYAHHAVFKPTKPYSNYAVGVTARISHFTNSSSGPNMGAGQFI